MVAGRGRGIVSRGVKGEDLREGSGFRREDGPRRPSVVGRRGIVRRFL